MELDRGTPSVEKALAGAVGVVGFVAWPSLLLMLVPDSVLDFEIERTSVEFAPAVLGAIRRKAGRAWRRASLAPPRTARARARARRRFPADPDPDRSSCRGRKSPSG